MTTWVLSTPAVATGVPKSAASWTRSPKCSVWVPWLLIQSGVTSWLPSALLMMLAPPLLVDVEEMTILVFEKMLVSSTACTRTAPPAVRVEPVTVAVAALEALLLTRMPPKLLPVALNSALAAESAALDTVALRRVALSARTVTSPSAVMVDPVTEALASATSLPLKAAEISGSPSRASMVLKRRF